MRITRNKAEEKFALYMEAEMKDNVSLANQLEEELDRGGWKIGTDENGVFGVIPKENLVGFLSGSNSWFLPRESQVYPSNSNIKNSQGISTGQIIVISVAGLALITGTILLIRHIKKQNALANG